MAEQLSEARPPRFTALAPFRHRAYLRLWTGAFVSNIGTWMEAVALGAYVSNKTEQSVWVGAVAAAAFVPIAIFGPIGGALADRFPRKALLLTTTLVQAALALWLTFLFATGEPSAPLVTAIAFGNGICAALGFPAFQALLPDLVPTEDIPGAVALSSTQYNLGRVVGPALAGLVIALWGYAAAEGVNAFSFLAVVAVLLTLTLPRPGEGARDMKMLASIAAGFRFVRREPGLRVNISAMCFNTFLAAPFIALVPSMAAEVSSNTDVGTAVLVTGQGIGAVAMGLMLGNFTAKYGPRRVLVRVMAALPFALAAYAVAPGLPLSALTIIVVGFFYLGALSSFTTIAQLRAPASIRGRVLSVHTVILGSLYPIGALIQGKVADSIGLRATTLGAAVAMGALLLLIRAVRPGYTAPLDEPVADSVDAGSSQAN
jgi:MFS family permease